MALIITGPKGSGKTLLRKVCNLHRDIELTAEFRNFMKLNVPYTTHVRAVRMSFHRYPLFNSKGGTPVSWRWKNAIFLTQYLIGLRVRCGALVGAGDVETVLRRIFPHASVVGDVCSQYVPALDRLAGTPDLVRTIIYRDCRDVVSCILDRIRNKGRKGVPLRGYDTAAEAATMWVRDIEAIERHAGQVHLIRYEDLVTDPQTVLTKFGHWLGVDPRGFQHEMIRSSWVDEYKHHLCDHEVASIMQIAGPTMERLGYL